jgi:hypothetical protein
VLAGPVAWALQLGFDYSLTKWSCNHGAVALHLVAIGALAIVAAGAFAAWQTLAMVPAHATSDGGRSIDRSHFMGILGLASSALFVVVVVASDLPVWTLHGVCW